MFQVSVIDFAGIEIRKGEPSFISKKDDGCYLLEDAELMLFTGLEDKNNKDIYEGDIIIGDWFYIEPTVITDLRVYFYNDVEYCPSENTEVIGNIYQNPEMVKE